MMDENRPIIVVKRRSHDWHASRDGDATRWEAGRSPAEAIARIRLSFPELADAPIRYGARALSPTKRRDGHEVKTITPDTLTADDVFAAAERQGVVIDEVDWAAIRDDGRMGCCPLTALAIDADPTIKDVVLESSFRVQRVTKLPPEFIRGLTDGFDHTPDWTPTERESESPAFMQGFRLGRDCLRRIKPQWFTPEFLGE